MKFKKKIIRPCLQIFNVAIRQKKNPYISVIFWRLVISPHRLLGNRLKWTILHFVVSIPVSENVQHFLNKIYDDRYAIKRAVYEVLIVFTVQNKSLSEVQVYIRANYHLT